MFLPSVVWAHPGFLSSSLVSQLPIRLKKIYTNMKNIVLLFWILHNVLGRWVHYPKEITYYKLFVIHSYLRLLSHNELTPPINSGYSLITC